jgi:geranylgeranyl pyrophosphate synthase
MFIFGMQMMQLISENKADFTKLMGKLGRYFQIRDDYWDLGPQEVTLSYQL